MGRVLRPKQRGYFHRGTLGPHCSEPGAGYGSISITWEHLDPRPTQDLASGDLRLNKIWVICVHTEVWEVPLWKTQHIQARLREQKRAASPHVCLEHCPGLEHRV